MSAAAQLFRGLKSTYSERRIFLTESYNPLITNYNTSPLLGAWEQVMSKRHKAWARAQRAILLEQLGGKCVECGTTENLTFDCIEPQGDRHHKLDTSARMSFYRRQLWLNNLQVLCQKHNSKKAAREPDYGDNLPW